jgi:KaiC/GvpD/RAD55 family RecA-like ATPase
VSRFRLRHFHPDAEQQNRTKPNSLAMVGRDGTGKSVFAFHLASTYHALHFYAENKKLLPEERRNPPMVVYFSSDLRWVAAEKIWRNFYLDYPWNRFVPFISPNELEFRRSQVGESSPFTIKLEEHSPGGKQGASDPTALESFLEAARRQPPRERKVCFVDLASETTGDDWLFVARFLASVPAMPKAPPNLLIVDSVAGFETLVGERNSYGDEMTRRARIAQIVRAAGDRWHVVLVVEEPDPGKHNPEEYVTDTVIHLRRESRAEKSRRTLAIEKSRARSVGVGEHPFEIRDGRGTSTRSWENPDDPYAIVHPSSFDGKLKELLKKRNPHTAYIQVFPSLHFLSQDFARSTRVAPWVKKPEGVVPFGVTYLDNMLAAVGDGAWRREGLPQGTVTSLVGDEGTLKASLAEQFLAQAFRDFPTMLNATLKLVKNFRASQLFVPKVDTNQYLVDYANSFLAELDARDPLRVRLKSRLENWYSGGLGHRKDELTNISRAKWRLRTPKELIERHGSGPLKTRWDGAVHYELCPDESDDESDFALALSILRSSRGLLTPAVFISTHDTSAEKICSIVMATHGTEIRKILKAHNVATDGEGIPEHAIERLIERFILVRRIDLVDATAPQLWQIIRDSSIHALYLVGCTLQEIYETVDPVSPAADIRVVISDLKLIRQTYPEVASDPLFLPTVVFRLRRMGFTTLIVDSDTGRPDQRPTHPMNGALRSLGDHQIYTWKVPFFGEQRIAISVIPPLNNEHAGVIRELKATELGPAAPGEAPPRRLDVDPHFELYMGVEEGKPVEVPLRVILYGETPAFEKYVAAEQDLFDRIFTAVDAHAPIVQIRKTRDYDGLRDYCHLPSDTRLPYSLVFMIDGYWALRRDTSLRDQTNYLTRPLEELNPGEQDREDSFQLFRRNAQQRRKWPDTVWKSRENFFVQRKEPKTSVVGAEYYYRHRFPVDIESRMELMDRVPFSWDFGFLLCRKKLWDNAGDVEFTHPRPRRRRVHDLWEEMRWVDPGAALAHNPILPTVKGSRAHISWRDFFEACIVVARTEERRTGARCPPFDLSVQTADSLISLIIEIWVSEIAADALRMRSFANTDGNDELREFARKWADGTLRTLRILGRFELTGEAGDLVEFQELLGGKGLGKSVKAAFQTAQDSPDPPLWEERDVAYARLLQHVQTGGFEGPGYALQLFKTWLLLMEVLDLRQYLDYDHPFKLVSDYQSSTEAPSTREWYRTACAQHPAAAGDEYGVRVPARLPGFFSVRGGWFLAVAKGSRSPRLAERALDLLSSRRGNRTRLHMGLGLPTRDILEGSTAANIRTALKVHSPDGEFPVTYGDLLKLGAQSEDIEPTQEFSSNGFHWLFRSAFRDYDRQTPVIKKWIHRLFEWSVQYRYANRKTWRGDFHSYDEIDAGDVCVVSQYGSFQSFPAAVDAMLEDLDAATLAQED